MDIELCIMGDLNGWIGDRTKAAITGAFGVAGENGGQWWKLQEKYAAQ